MSIIDLIFPTNFKCINCGAETDRLAMCDDCVKYLTFVPSPHCAICGGELSGKGKVCVECKGREFKFDKNYSIFLYDDIVRNKIIDFKQNRHKAIGEMFAYFVEDKCNEIFANHNIDIIIPVPISDERLKERRFNQSEVLCSRLPKDKLMTDILKRIKPTPHQTGLSRVNREDNLKSAFEVTNKKIIKGKTILLVDDIYTTGSTLNACSSELVSAGAKKIIALTLARVPVRKDRILD